MSSIEHTVRTGLAKQLRHKTVGLLAALASVSTAAHWAIAQEPQAQRNANDKSARIDLEESKKRGFTVDAPATMPLKDTNYPIPAGALPVAPDGSAPQEGSPTWRNTIAR